MVVIERDDVRFVVDTDKCCGCKRCVRTCQEDVWRWDEWLKCAIPRYPDECVKCYQCEVECLGECFEIIPLSVMLSDPLENRMMEDQEGE